MNYADLDIEVQLAKITAENGHIGAITEIGKRWQAAYTELDVAGNDLRNDSVQLSGYWKDANGARFAERATQTAGVMLEWAKAIASAAPWQKIDALVVEIPPTFQAVSQAAEEIRKLRESATGAGGETALVAMLQAMAGERMNALAVLYTEAAAALQGIRGPAWAGPATAPDVPGGAGSAPPGGAPADAAGGEAALAGGGGGPAAAGAAGAGGGGSLAGGGATAPPGATPPVAKPPVATPPGMVPPKPVVPPTRVPNAVRPGSGAISPAAVASPSRGSARTGGVPGASVAGRSAIPVVAPMSEQSVAPPQPGKPGLAQAAGATGAGQGNATRGMAPMAPHMGGGGGGTGQRPGPGVTRQQPTGRGQTPARTPGLPDQLGGRAGKLDRRAAEPGVPGRAGAEESPLDNELWDTPESPHRTNVLGERR